MKRLPSGRAMVAAVGAVSTALALCLLPSCSGSSISPLGSPASLTVAVGHEAITVSWASVDGAAGYEVYFTDDGTAPTTASSRAGSTTDTSFTHDGIDPEKRYAYAVVATAGGRVSEPSVLSGTSPEPMLHLTVTFDSYPASPVGAMLVETDASGAVTDRAAAMGTTTSADGTASFELGIHRGRYWGYTVWKDADASGTISAGDQVWGSNPTGYTYLHWMDAVTTSMTVTKDWSTAVAETTTYSGPTITP